MAEEIDALLGKKLREIREKKGMSLNDVAERIGKSRYTYYDYEKGKTRVFWSVFIDICKALDVDYAELSNDIQKEYNIKQALKNKNIE